MLIGRLRFFQEQYSRHGHRAEVRKKTQRGSQTPASITMWAVYDFILGVKDGYQVCLSLPCEFPHRAACH